jgi:hypothetical protein
MVDVSLSDQISISDEIDIIPNFLFTEQAIGSILSNIAPVYYIEQTKSIPVNLNLTTFLVYQQGEEIEWIGYGGLQNIRHASIEADVRSLNGQVTLNNISLTANEFIQLVINEIQDYGYDNWLVNDDRILFIKVKSGRNMQDKERGIEYVEFVISVDVLSNNFGVN